MVFSSAPLYLDPHNWHHHQQQDTTANHDVGVDNGGDNNPDHHQISAPMPPPLPSQSIVSGNSSSIKPGSMADRARQAKLPHPEPGLKCPRCQSTNTKFCYFNNYNFAQPRHFCKMCRRYWTKGGALRNVPVGGGFRKNSKKSSNKGGGRVQKAMGEHQDRTSPISSKSNNTDTINNFNNMLDNCTTFAGQSYQPPMTQFPLLASIHGLNHHGQYGTPTSNNLGLSFGGMMSGMAEGELGFHIGSSASSVNADHQWRRPNHFHNNFLAAFDPSPFSHRPSSSSSPASSLYHFPISHQSLNQQEAINHNLVKTSSMPLKNFNDEKDNESAAVVKAEEGMNSFSRSFLGMSDNSHEYLNANNSTTHGQILNRKMGGW